MEKILKITQEINAKYENAFFVKVMNRYPSLV